MRVSQQLFDLGRGAISLALCVALTAPAVAQTATPQDQPSTAQTTVPPKPEPQKHDRSMPDFSKPVGYFPNPLGPYSTRKVAEPSFTNTPRIGQLIRDGKLYLSLDDAIALALENNLDVAIARYNLQIADTDILRAKAGQGIRGVATGLVQGTPGGGQGGFGTGASGASAGGTSSGAGGAGAGSSGLVQSTTGVGPTVESFDPFLSGTLQLEHSISPQSNTVFTGVPTLQQNSGTANFSYNQGFFTGTALSVGFNNSRSTTNSPRSVVNPTLNSNFRAIISQHLLQGFGPSNQLRFIHIAQNNKQISDLGFRDQVITTVAQIQNIYWDLVNAYEDVKVKQGSLALAKRTESDNRKQVEIGTLAPIEIVRATSEVATRNQDLIISQTNLQLQQTLMLNAISRNLNDATLANTPVVPTDTMILPATEEVTPVDELVKEALTNRPDINESRIDLTNRTINRKAARNSLLPTVDLFGFYGASALGGAQNPLAPCGAAPLAPCFTSTGYGSTFGSLFDSSAPDKGAGISLTIPIRNRAAQADQVRSELEYRQAELRLQQLQNTINIQVRNDQFAFVQNRARVDAAQEAEKLANQSLDAEQKKYQLGASTSFNVLQSQRDLVQAQVNTVAAKAAYEKSRVELDRVTGRLLDRYGITMSDALSGSVQTMPVVPSVGPAPQQPGTQQPTQQQPQPPQPQSPSQQ
jgi:outer membrane protein